MGLAINIALSIVALNVAGAIVLSIATTIHDWRKSRCKHDGYRECAECRAWLDGAETEIYRVMEGKNG